MNHLDLNPAPLAQSPPSSQFELPPGYNRTMRPIPRTSSARGSPRSNAWWKTLRFSLPCQFRPVATDIAANNGPSRGAKERRRRYRDARPSNREASGLAFFQGCVTYATFPLPEYRQ